MRILVTGGLGFIGSHTSVELLNEGMEVIIVDNLYNSKESVLDKIEQITNKKVKLYKKDLTDKEEVERIFNSEKIDAVIHFAGFKAVGESVREPLMYYSNNLISTINLLEVMKKHNVKNFIFSSSATVYGDQGLTKYAESVGRGKTTNPYGTTKAMIEKMLEDLYASDNTWNITILRYFNPVGAHESGLIGESPNGIPNNLMPYVMRVASKKLEILSVYGNDYPTPDGTGIRDYIHVVDLSLGHIKAIEYILKNKGIDEYNLGTGNGFSVLQLVKAFEKVNGIKVNYKITDRRAGDIDACYADSSKAKEILGWEAQKGIDEMCKDAYNFVIKNK